MTHVTYRIVRHDEGWAYKAGDVFSEPFRTHAAALAAAKRAAQEQRVPRRFRAAQQFLQMLGIGPSGSTVSRPVVPSSVRTAGGRVLCVG